MRADRAGNWRQCHTRQTSLVPTNAAPCRAESAGRGSSSSGNLLQRDCIQRVREAGQVFKRRQALRMCATSKGLPGSPPRVYEGEAGTRITRDGQKSAGGHVLREWSNCRSLGVLSDCRSFNSSHGATTNLLARSVLNPFPRPGLALIGFWIIFPTASSPCRRRHVGRPSYRIRPSRAFCTYPTAAPLFLIGIAAQQVLSSRSEWRR